MKIIIPMAGIGKRMRPHTLSIPKPLLKIAGKSIVERIVEDLAKSTGKKIEEIHFIIGNFGATAENNLINIAERIGAKAFIHYQNEPLGTAHAVYCAAEGLNGEIIIAFADTLFFGNFEIQSDEEAIIWTMDVENPENYGVVVIDNKFIITDFVEKPEEHISNKAIIGIYYFKEGERLKADIENLFNNKIIKNGEYQLTDSLINLKINGIKFKCKNVEEWLDCGNKEEFLKSSKRILFRKSYSSNKCICVKADFVEPVYVGKNVTIKNAKIGPYVSIDDNVIIENSVIAESIIGFGTSIFGSEIFDSIVGNNTKLKGCRGRINIGDFNTYEGL